MDQRCIIHLYTFCRDEELLLPFFLRHYDYVDKITVFFDRYSQDNSKSIIDSNTKCKRINFDFAGEYRDDFLMYAKNSEWKSSIGIADWVIVVDLDEFLYHKDSVREYLKVCKSQNISIPLTTGYDMISEEPLRSDLTITQQVKYGVKNKRFDKKVIFDPKLISDISFRPGAHLCDPEGVVRYSPISKLKLLHYKYLGGIERFSNRWNTFGNNLSQVNIKNNWSIKRKDPKQAIYRYEYVKEHAVKII